MFHEGSTMVPMNGEILESGMQVKVTKEYKVRFDIPVLQLIATSTDFPYCESEPIIFYESKWIIRVFPNGCDKETISEIKVVLLGTSETDVEVEYSQMLLIDKTVAHLSKTSPESNVPKAFGGTSKLLRGTSMYICPKGHFEFQLSLSKTDEHEIKVSDESKTLFCDHLFHKATSDVDIVVEGTRIPAHKLILSLASPVFTAMFENQMQESVSNEIVISDFSDEVVRSMLRCIYDSTSVVSEMENHADQLLLIANKYELTEIERSATIHISKNITVDNAIHVLLSADKFDRVQIKSAAMNFIVNNADDFFCWSDFVDNVGSALMSELLEYIVANKRLK